MENEIKIQATKKSEVIAIIGGSGAMGRSLAYRWLKAGYKIILGSRSLGGAESVVDSLKVRLPQSQISAMQNSEAARQADIVVLTIPYAHHETIIKEISSFLAGKLLIDTTVPLSQKEQSIIAAAQEVLKWVGDDVDIVAAFHNISAHLLNSDRRIDCDVLVTGNKTDARQRVIDLAADAGLQAWHAGPLANAIVTEMLTPILLNINKLYGIRNGGIRISSNSNASFTNYAPDSLQLIALKGIPSINEGDDLAEIVWQALTSEKLVLEDGDILIISQKIISKAEGRMIKLDNVAVTPEALQLSEEIEKDPRLTQLILNESIEVIRKKRGVIIVEHRSGVILANAGIDQSNVPLGYALLLPKNADASAIEIRNALKMRSEKQIAVVINDSIGRAWRNGVVGHAIGIAGLDPLIDLRGKPDMLCRPLQITQVAVADSIAAIATLMMGEANELKPVILMRGYKLINEKAGVQALFRDKREDLFR